MLRRLSRPLSALFALWFAFVLVDPGVLHACPMHGGTHAVQQAPATHAEHSAHHDGAPQDENARLCTCVGHCPAATAEVPVPLAPTFAVPVHVAEPVSLFAEPCDVAPASPDVSLPFANGPPQA